jgi:hypothetical protein
MLKSCFIVPVFFESEPILTSFKSFSKMRATKGSLTIGRVGASKAKNENSYRSSSKTVAKEIIEIKKLPARASRKQVNYKEESEKESEVESEEDDEGDYGFGAVEVVEEAKKEVFAIFEAGTELEEGLCIVRSLGGGKYELVNLNTVPRGLIASEDTGNILKGDPERRQMFAINKEQWDEAILKTELAAKSAGEQSSSDLNVPTYTDSSRWSYLSAHEIAS